SHTLATPPRGSYVLRRGCQRQRAVSETLRETVSLLLAPEPLQHDHSDDRERHDDRRHGGGSYRAADAGTSAVRWKPYPAGIGSSRVLLVPRAGNRLCGRDDDELLDSDRSRFRADR